MDLIDTIFVSCHLCHAGCGQQCRWGVSEGEFHSRRVAAARRQSEERAKDFEAWAKVNADVHHAIEKGALCELGKDGFCRVCGDDGRFFRNL